jgi:RimJ/RimL family protein N-acetyltransferase
LLFVVTATENERTVLEVLADRFAVPIDRLEAGRLTVVATPEASAAVRVFAHDGDTLVMARPEHVELAGRLLSDPAMVEAGLAELAEALGGRLIGVVARTGLEIPAPEVDLTLTTAADRRLPDWVHGHFTGPAWVVLSPDGRVLSTAVLKDYDERLREISVGTEEEARGRGLARAVVRAAARDVLAQGRAVLYLHDIGNDASAAVAKAAGLHEVARLISVVGERVGDEQPDQPDQP